MSYRDDADAARARADAAEHAQRTLAATHARLTDELAGAREWLGGARKRWAIAAGIAAVAAIGAGFAIGRFTGAAYAEEHPVAVHEIPSEASGSLAVLGTVFGRGAAKASLCTRRAPDTAVVSILGTGGHSVAVTPTSVTLVFAGIPYRLDKGHCARLSSSLTAGDGLAGAVDFDCTFGDNRAVGRFAFDHCR